MPRMGKDVAAQVPTVRPVTAVAAPFALRLALAASLLALVAALVPTAGAEGAPSAWSSYLAAAGGCANADNGAASAAEQRRALVCLVNVARAHQHSGRLERSPRLMRAAVLKGRRLVSCGTFTHTPCGSDAALDARAAGYDYGVFAENLYAATWGTATPRMVVLAWLQSPGHRHNLLRPGFRHFGTALVRANGFLGGQDAVVWVAHFGSPR